SIASRNGLPSASRCCWPTNSSRVRGRIRAASGSGVREANSDSLSSSRRPLERRSGIFSSHDSLNHTDSTRERSCHQVQTTPEEKARGDLPATLRLKLRYEIRCPDVQRDSRGNREAVVLEHLELVGQQDAKNGG